MTVFNVAKLPTASWKEVSFFYQDGSIDGGRNTVSHEYPNAKKGQGRFVEDNGSFEKKFTITAWTDDNVSFNQRDALIKVLEVGGAGYLQLPNFPLQNVSLINYTLTNSITELGVSKFTLNFEFTSVNGLKQKDGGKIGLIAQLKSKILGKNEANFDKLVSNVKNAKIKFDSFNQSLVNVGNKINNVSKIVAGSADTFSDFASSVNKIINSSKALVQSPSVLASNLRFSFDNLELAYSSSKDVFTVAKNLFGFDCSDRVSNGNSQLQKDIKNNQKQLNDFVAISALALAYNSAVNIDYKTLDELNSVINDLENGFNLLPLDIDREVYKLILQSRIASNEIFSQLAISLPNINIIDIVNPVSLNNLVFSLYGSLDLKESIRQINNLADTSEISGSIKIFTNV